MFTFVPHRQKREERYGAKGEIQEVSTDCAEKARAHEIWGSCGWKRAGKKKKEEKSKKNEKKS